MAKVIKLKPTPTKSYNPERRPSALLLDQVKHLEWAALPASQRKPEQLKVYKQVKTEWQAAERIAQLTELIKEAKRERPLQDVALGALPPVVLPPLPPRMPHARGEAVVKKSGVARRKRRAAGSRKAKAGAATRAKPKRAASASGGSRAKTKVAQTKSKTSAKGARSRSASKHTRRGKRS